MTALSQPTAATQSKRMQAGLKLVAMALSATPLDVLSEAIAKDDTQVSRIRSGQLGAGVQDVVKLLYAAGVKCVPADRVCVSKSKYEAMVTMVSAAMSCPVTVRRLTFDEAEE